jgi:hypothetical protein
MLVSVKATTKEMMGLLVHACGLYSRLRWRKWHGTFYHEFDSRDIEGIVDDRCSPLSRWYCFPVS